MAAPACLFGPRFDLVAWNDTFDTIWKPQTLPADRRNVVWMGFCVPERRRTWVNWEERSWSLLSEFRTAAGRHPGGARFDELVAALAEASAEFRSWWASYEVRSSINGPLQIRHRAVGVVRFDVTELRVCGHPALTLSVHTPAGASDRRKVEVLLSQRHAVRKRRDLQGASPLDGLRRAHPSPAMKRSETRFCAPERSSSRLCVPITPDTAGVVGAQIVQLCGAAVGGLGRGVDEDADEDQAPAASLAATRSCVPNEARPLTPLVPRWRVKRR